MFIFKCHRFDIAWNRHHTTRRPAHLSPDHLGTVSDLGKR